MNADKSSDGPAGDDAGVPGLTHSARLGLFLFAIYLILYGGFVGLNAFAPQKMGEPIESLGGINIAIAYGIGLIVAALVLAVIYMLLCRGEGESQEAGQ